MSQTRQLAAIMFTDIVGYTALMGEDEQKAFQILNKNRELQKPIIEKYGGRWIKEIGDGVMASFNTVSDAVYAAKEIQEQCKQTSEFSLRIGIHLGEIVFEGDDVFGDAVNVASRIQSIAPVGGIYVSEIVHNDVFNKADIQTQFVKVEKLKNVREPLRIYEIKLDKTYSGEQPKRLKRVTTSRAKKHSRSLFILVASAIIVGGTVYFLMKGKTLFAGSGIESIAVLPFVNESTVADMEYLSDGMTETLINSLSKLQDVSVKARSSVFHYRGKDFHPTKIGKELAVQAILNGRVAQRGDNISLHLELVDVRTGDLIWGEQYNRKTADLVSLQSEIATDVSHKLKARLSGEEQKTVTKNYTQNAQAYQLYLRGRFHWNKRTEKDLLKAIDYFKRAIDMDSSYALAFTGLADAYSLLPNYSKFPSSEMMPLAQKFAMKALSLDNNLAEAHAALGAILATYNYDFARAESEYKKAITLNPNYATTHQWYGELLSYIGRHEEAILEFQRALELDPFSVIINRVYGEILSRARKYDESIAQLKKTIELDVHFPHVYRSLFSTYQMTGNYAEGVEALVRYFELLGLNKEAALANKSFAKGGWQKFLQAMTDERVNLPPNIKAGILAELGEKDKAFAELEKAYQNREFYVVLIKADPRIDRLRDDPRWQELMRKVGFPE
jgi:class 3 adenylate cyclase/TolB-like protein/Flp pilus assembly protein TadD